MSAPLSAASASSAYRARAREEARQVASRFGSLRTAENAVYFDALCEHFRHLCAHPVLPLHFEYALSANARGRAAAGRLLSRVPLATRRGWPRRRPRVLDVGCAYGGFLVAFSELGARVTGIEIDQRLLGLAEINLRDNGVDAELVRGDATGAHPGFRGRFDLIVANDVVEHVERLDRLLENLRDWLTPSGAVYLEIPNGAHPAFVLRDGHHQLFGISLLDLAEGSEYVRALNPDGMYDTYNSLSLDAYRAAFAARGLSLEVLPETLAGVTAEGVSHQLDRLREGLEAGLATVPDAMRPLVRRRVSDYLARAGTASKDGSDLLEYGPGFWIAVARRIA